MSGFKEFVSNLFSLKSKSDVSLEMTSTNDIEQAFQIEMFATFTVIDFIARILAKCEIQTYRKGKKFKGPEWYSLNFEPNKNQNAKEFFYEFYATLLYNSEVLAFPFGKELLIAEDFTVETHAFEEYKFLNVCRDTTTFHGPYTTSDVIYCKYCNTNVRSLLNGIAHKYAEAMQAAHESYILSSGKKGILTVSALAQNDKSFEERFKKLINESFRKFFKERNAVLPLYNGFSYTDISSSGEKSSNSGSKINDLKSLFDDALSRAAQVYQVPPVIFKGEVENTENAMDLLIASCLDPLTKLTSTEFTRKKCTSDDVINGTYYKIDLSKIMPVDIFRLAEKIDKLISNGYLSIDELREETDRPPCNEKWSKRHYLTKNYEPIENIDNNKGGEE